MGEKFIKKIDEENMIVYTNPRISLVLKKKGRYTWSFTAFKINEKLNFIKLHSMSFEDKKRAISFAKKYMKIDFGGISYLVTWVDHNYDANYKLFIGKSLESPSTVEGKAHKFHNKKDDDIDNIRSTSIRRVY